VEVSFEDEDWGDFSPDVKDLVLKMLCLEANRYSAHQCLEHPWFKLETVSKVQISSQTLQKFRKFSTHNLLKKAILNFIAYNGIQPEEIQKYRKIFSKLDENRQGFIGKEDITKILS